MLDFSRARTTQVVEIEVGGSTASRQPVPKRGGLPGEGRGAEPANAERPELAGSSVGGGGPAPPRGSLHLEIVSLGGGLLALIDDAGPEWYCADVVDRLPAPLPGHTYRLVYEDGVLDTSRKLTDQLPDLLAAGAEVQLNGLLQQTAEAQSEMDAALEAASAKHDRDQVTRLLAAGASANAECLKAALVHPQGAAMQPTRLEVVSVLLSAGADINFKPADHNYHQTIFDSVLCGFASCDLEVLLECIKYRADPCMVSACGACGRHAHGRWEWYPLHSILGVGGRRGFQDPPYPGSVSEAREGAVKVLLEARASANARCTVSEHGAVGMNVGSGSPLHVAASLTDGLTAARLCGLLLSHGADPNAQHSRSVGCDAGQPRTFGKMRCCVPRRQVIEERPLHIAIRHGHPEVVRALVAAGANPILSFRRSDRACSPAEELRVAAAAAGAEVRGAVLEAAVSLFLRESIPGPVMERALSYAFAV